MKSVNATGWETPEEEALHEECGVFGIYDPSGESTVAGSIYYGLMALQHRGQESCGIAVTDTYGPNRVYARREMGLVNEAFTKDTLRSLEVGNLGVGHVRYSTAGNSTRENAQPLVINYLKGTMAMAHNGNLVNTPQLRRQLARDGAIFQTTIDSEIVAYEIARERAKCASVEEAIANAMAKMQGAYSLVIMSPRKLIGCRDPHGFRPLVIGRRKNTSLKNGGYTWIMTSETCALDTLGAEYVRDVEPGEIVTINKYGEMTSNKNMCIACEKRAACVFEYIYFARPDSVLDGVSVYHSRLEAGRFLSLDSPVEADLVVGVPESGNVAAMGYATASKIPYGTAFVKNSYMGRTFIKPSQQSRESAVHIKLNVLREAVAGKRIIMIDDSIVRGTTSGQIVSMLREAGAKEVHVRISSPPFLHPCYFGTDVPSEDQLIAHGRTVEEIRALIGADSLAFLKEERLSELVDGKIHLCKACFNGDYPIEPPTEDIRGEFEQ